MIFTIVFSKMFKKDSDICEVVSCRYITRDGSQLFHFIYGSCMQGRFSLFSFNISSCVPVYTEPESIYTTHSSIQFVPGKCLANASNTEIALFTVLSKNIDPDSVATLLTQGQETAVSEKIVVGGTAHGESELQKYAYFFVYLKTLYQLISLYSIRREMRLRLWM